MPKLPLDDDPHGYGELWTCGECGETIDHNNPQKQCERCNDPVCDSCLFKSQTDGALICHTCSGKEAWELRDRQ